MMLGTKLGMVFTQLLSEQPLDLSHVEAADIETVAGWSKRRWGSAIEKICGDNAGIVKKAVRKHQATLRTAIVARARELGCLHFVKSWEEAHEQKVA